MATQPFTIQLQDQELTRQLDRAIERLDDAGPLLDQIGSVLESRINQRFDTKQDPAGKPWAPLSLRTRELYAAQDSGRRQGTLLERTGRMRASLSYQVLGDDAVQIGFGVPYAGYHETGTRTKGGGERMPRRGLLTDDWEAGTLGEGDREAVMRVLEQYLDDAVGE